MIPHSSVNVRVGDTVYALVIFIAGLLLTLALIFLINTGSFIHLEESILLLFRHSEDLANPLGSSAIEESIRDLTALGGTLTTTLITLFMVFLLLLNREPRYAAFLALSVIIGTGYVFLIKAGYGRLRPEVVPQLMRSLSPSFPSGHSAVSAMVYILVGTIASLKYSNKTVRTFFLFTALLITAGVGVSRVYLGMHWPSDVLGGWFIGLSWAGACLMLGKSYLRKD